MSRAPGKGRTWLMGSPEWTILLGEALGRNSTCFRKGINIKYGRTGRGVLFLRPRTYSHLNARVERNLTRRAHANDHTGGNSTSTLGFTAIEPPLKGKFRLQETIPMNYVEAVSPWWSHSSMDYCPQTVSIVYCGSHIGVTHV